MDLTVLSKIQNKINLEENEVNFQFDILKIKTGIIFTSWVQNIGPTFEILYFLHDFDKHPENTMVRNYKSLCLKGADQKEIDDLDIFYKNYNILKQKKYKTKTDLLDLNQKQGVIKELKKRLLTYCTGFCKHYNIDVIEPFIDNKVFDSKMINPGMITEYFVYTISEYHVNYCLDGTHFNIAKNQISSENTSFQNSDDWSFYNIPLFKMPDLTSLNNAQLNIIRAEFIQNFDPFYKPFCELQVELDKITYDESNFETIQQKIDEVFNPHLAIFKESAENNIYFNMIKNSIPDVPFYQFSAVVTSLKNLIDLLVKDNIITPAEKKIIIEGVGRTKNINNTAVFFYLDKL